MSATSPKKPRRRKSPNSDPAKDQQALFRELVKQLPDMDNSQLAELLVDLKPLRAAENTTAQDRLEQDRAHHVIRAPRNDDELHEWILRETGYNIPRVAVCSDHCAPFDPISDAYFNRYNAILILGSRESGKCLPGDSLIYDPEMGDRVPLKEVVEGRLERVLTMTEEGQIKIAPITARWNTGTKKCLRITTLSGREVEVTPEHPFMTTRGWVRADEVQEDEHIAVPASIPMPSAPTWIPDGDVDLLAVLLTEGSYTHDTVGFSTGDQEILRIMGSIAEFLECDLKHQSAYDYLFVKRSGLRNPVRERLDSYGIGHEKAVDKKIPEAVFRLSREQLQRFLSLFWMCDGYIMEKGPEICMGSRVMIEQLQHLLLRFGVQSKLAYKRTSCNGKSFDSWRLTIYMNCIEQFAQAVPMLWGDKLGRLEMLLAKNRCPTAGRPTVTPQMMEMFRHRFPPKKRGMSADPRIQEAQKLLGWSSRAKPLAGIGPSILTTGGLLNLQARRLRALCHAHSVEECEFALLLSEEIWWDPVVSVESVGVKSVYDLTMEPTQSFVANDVVVHNTIGVAILHYVNAETKPGCEGLTFGAILPQAKRAYRYIKDFIYTRDEDGNRVKKPQIQGDPTREKTEWKIGSSVEIVVGTLSGVNSPHTQVVHADEIDIMEREVWKESRNISSSKMLPDGTRIPAIDIATSTRKSTRGLMQEILNEVDEAKRDSHIPPWQVYAYCCRETAAEVPCCRVVDPVQRVRRLLALGRSPNETCRCHEVVKGEWGPGQPRTLESVCRGDFFRSRGWMHYDDIARKFMQNSQAVWEAQMECRRPMADGLYLPTFSRPRHAVRGWMPRPQYGRISMGVDWGGGDGASVVLWVQGPMIHPVEVVGFTMKPLIIPQGGYVVFDQFHWDERIGATRMADLVVAREIAYRQEFPGWRVRGRFADMAGAQQRNDWHEHSPPLRTQWYITRDFDPSVETVQTLMTDNLLYVDVSRCSELADDFEGWRMKGGKECHDAASHGPASLRYCLSNVVVMERRLGRSQGSTEVLPVVRERAVDAVDRAGLLGAVGSGAQGVETEAWRRSIGMLTSNVGADSWQP